MAARRPYSDEYPDQIKTSADAFLFDLLVGELIFIGATRDEAEGYVATNFGLLRENPPDLPWLEDSVWGRINWREDPSDPAEQPGGVWIV